MYCVLFFDLSPSLSCILYFLHDQEYLTMQKSWRKMAITAHQTVSCAYCLIGFFMLNMFSAVAVVFCN